MKLTNYIAHVKIEAAKKKLLYTRDSYEEIAYALGFSTQSHFGQVFKKYAGMTPGQELRDFSCAAAIALSVLHKKWGQKLLNS